MVVAGARGRVRSFVLGLVTLVAVVGAMLVVIAGPQPAHAAVTGTGGQFVPMTSNARVFDGATSASFTTVPVEGVSGLPSSGIGAVTMMITVVNASGQGQLVARPDASQPNTELMIYGSGVSGNVSNSALLAVGSGGSVQIATQNAQSRVVVDVTGYYTSTANGVGAGGFVPITAAKVADTRDGTGGVAKAPLSGGGSVSFSVAGTSVVPSGAAAVQASVIVINRDGNPGFVRVSPAGGTKSTGTLNYPGIVTNTAMSTQVALGSNGGLTIDNATGGGTVDLQVVIQGYFLPSNPGGGFTPQTGRLADTRSGAGVAAGSSVSVPVAGVLGVPSMQDGLSAVAVTLTAVNGTSSPTVADVYADGSSVPNVSAINSAPNSQRTTTVIVGVGTNGAIRIKNVGSTSMNYVVDLQGSYNTLPGGPSTTNLTGSRSSATNLSFPIDDRTSAQVDVATGNLLVSTNALTMTGVSGSVAIGAAYNSRGTGVSSTLAPDANKWSYALDGAGSLSSNATGIVYTGPDGSTWQFTDAAGGTFTAPAGLQDTLAQTSTDYTLTSWSSNQVIHFNLAGQAVSVVDRYSNQFLINHNNYLLSNLVTNAGPSAARTASVTYSNGTTTISQTDGTNTRSVSWSKDGNGNVTSFTDAAGKTTTFGYSGTDLTSATSPNGGTTTFVYNSSDQVTEVHQPTASSSVAVTRFSYVSGTQTQVASPNTDTSQSVASVAHTDYTLDASTHNVTKAIDPDGNTRSATYNPDNNAAASTTAGSGSESTTANGTWSGNSATTKNVSLTQVQSTSGASGSQTSGPKATATYANSGAAAYLPSQTTDGDGNTTKVSYDSQGGISGSSVNGSGGSGPSSASQANLTRNTNGTLKSATSPGNQAANLSTQYTYDTNSQLSSVAPPTIAANTGTQLGTKTYKYDGYGRMLSETDGNGHTTSYTYDNDDRQLTESFSDGTASITNTYDGNGNELTSASAGGTITNTYDPLGHLTSTQNSAGSSTISYTYDQSGNESTSTDGSGTITYSYDAANVLWAMTYPHGSSTETDRYKIDSQSRLTDSYTAAGTNASTTTNATNTQPTSFQGHIHTSYDQGTGRESEIIAYTGQDAVKAFDTQYSYTTAAGASSNQLQSATDTLTGKVTHYGYVDQNGNSTTRLTGVTQTGGTNDVNWAYTYDADGNRTAATETGAATFNQTLSYNVNDQIDSAGFAYDAAGNMTASPTASYAYNGAEQLTSETVNGTTTNYTYAGAAQDQLLTATTGSTTASYTYGQSGVDTFTTNGATARVLANSSGQVLNLTDANGDSAAFVVDGIGNQVGALTDTGGNAFTVTYDPYGTGGVTTGATNPFWTQNPFGFKVGARSSRTQNDIVRFGLRWYLPTTGTWTQRDTLDAPLDPNNADRYAYAGDDPANGSDPSGNLFSGGVTGHFCAFVCANIGVEYESGGLHLVLGAGAGADVGASADIGGDVNKESGGAVYGSCEGSAGPAGLYGELGAQRGEGDQVGVYGGGGYAPGAEAGCSVNYSYEF